MSRLTIDAWEQREKNSLITFKAEIASRLEEAIFQALTEAMREQLDKDGKAEIPLPWGTYRGRRAEPGDLDSGRLRRDVPEVLQQLRRIRLPAS